MSDLSSLTARLQGGGHLTAPEIEIVAATLAASEESDESKAAFLTALALKGETAEEVAAFAEAFRARAINPGVEAYAPRAIDVVGTGGDQSGGFNISSLVVLTLACAGVPVMKHGNRGATSKCGSADLLAALGVNLEATPEKIRAAIDQLGYAFFFAPAYHPAFRHIGPVRKALAARGQRTIFNVLGPLINPGRPAHVLIGVYAPAWVPKFASALEALGVQAGLAAHGVISATQGIDEITTATTNVVRGIGRLSDLDATWIAADFGLEPSPFSDLVGGDLATNLSLVDAILAGRGPRGLVDTIVLNTAIGMWLTGKVAQMRDGVGPAREFLTGGAVAKKIAATKEFYRA